MFKSIIQTISENQNLADATKQALVKELKKCEKEVKRRDFKAKRIEVEHEVNKRFLNTSVTELEQKNQLLKKYVESNLQLENFAHIASHDLKAPLNNILTFSKLLQKTTAGKLNPPEEKFVGFIIEGAKNMKQTIHALLQFSIVTNKKIEVASFCIKDLLVKLERDLKSTLSEKRAQLHFPQLPKVILADPTLLREVFQNLILNGIKFCHNSTPRIDIDSKESETHWIFSVKDNGIGIAEEYKEKIFIMLQRLNEKTEFEGTGMGLSICKKIVEQHNGEIWVESELEQGSTFYFSIEKKEIKLDTTTETMAVAR